MSKECVVILGAGPAGLSAAHELVKNGIRPLILEKSGKVGGLARTEFYKGYGFDIGGHRFFTRHKSVQQLWQEMLGDDFKNVSRLSRIYFKERFFNYPLESYNAFSNLGPIESLLILLSYLKAQLRPYPMEKTFEQWVSNRFGARLYRTFFKAYTEKVWGMPGYRIQADWAAQRIRGLTVMSALLNAFFGTQREKTLIHEFHYPSKGPGMMWQGFHGVIEAGGGKFHLNCHIMRLAHRNGRIKEIVFSDGRHSKKIHADHVISSIPIKGLVSLLDPEPPESVRSAGLKLKHRAFVMVGLILHKREVFPDQWIYVHSPMVKVGRIQNFKNWSAAMVPDLDRTSLGMEYFCDEGDRIWKMSDSQLLGLASHETETLGLAKRTDIEDGFVVRQGNAYPIYSQGYDNKLRVIRSYLEGIENLQTIGRNGLHRYNNMDHAMLTGIGAAENIIGENHDLWNINEEQLYLEGAKPSERLDREGVLTRTFARIDKFAFAAAVGITSGLFFFLATAWLLLKGGDVIGPNLRLLGQYFIGYTVTWKGAFIGLAYGLGWGFIYGWLFAYVRNLFLAIYAYRIKKRAEFLTLRDFFDHL